MHTLWTTFRSTLRDLATFASIWTEPFVMLREVARIDSRHGPKVKKRVFLIRHPHTDEAVDKIYRGDDAQITQKGWEQADLVASRIAEISAVTHIVTSTLPRSTQLAELIAKKVTDATHIMPVII